MFLFLKDAMIVTLRTLVIILMTLFYTLAQAEILPSAVEVIKIPLAKQPTSRPMSVAYVPMFSRYYIADGGYGAITGNNGEMVLSRSEIHAYDNHATYLHSIRPGMDTRSLYFNPNTHRLEGVTYDVSSDAGFLPNSGIFSFTLDDKGNLTSDSDTIANFNPAFGDAATAPSYDPVGKRFFAKQERSNKVRVVKPDSRDVLGEVTLDLAAAGVQFDDISDHYVAWTGITGEELAVLDVDHKAVLVFDANGKFIGRSALPATLKLRAQNHYNGLGYCNGLFFVYHEKEGEFGTYYGFKVSDRATHD